MGAVMGVLFNLQAVWDLNALLFISGNEQLYKIFKIYCKYKVSVFGYSNLKRDSKRLDILWCLHVASRHPPPRHFLIKMLLKLMQQRVGVPWKGWVLLFLLLFSDLPLIFLKPENYKFHLETFNFPPFLLYLSSLGILSLTVKCYYPVTSLISLNCVHSDGFKLSRELFIDCCFHCCCLNIWDVLYEVTSLSFKAHFWLLDTPRWRHCGLYNEFVFWICSRNWWGNNYTNQSSRLTKDFIGGPLCFGQ